MTNSVGKPVASNNVKFGWGWGQHEAIQNASIKTMNNSSFKDYLKKNDIVVHRQSVDEDVYHGGVSHFINMETISKNTSGRLNAEERQFEKVNAYFSDERKTKVTDHFQNKPLNHDHLMSFDNVYRETHRQYNQLVKALKAFNNPDLADKSPEQRNQFKHKLAQTVGKMLHYVGDLTQPMHSSQYYDWPVPVPQDATSHFFMELFLKSEGDYIRWADDYVRGFREEKKDDGYTGKDYPVKAMSTLSKSLRQSVQESYLTLFDIVDGDRQLRKGNETQLKQDLSVRTDYANKFLEMLWGIAQRRMGDAARLGTELLNRAYAQAGYPEI